MPRINVLQRAAELRQNAARLDALIDSKRAKSARQDADELARVQRLLRALADRLDADALDPLLLQVRTAVHDGASLMPRLWRGVIVAPSETLLVCDEMTLATSEQFRRLAAAGLDAASDGTTIMRCTLCVRRAKDVPSPYAKAALFVLEETAVAEVMP